MNITKQQLEACLPQAKKSKIDKYYPALVDTFSKFRINTPQRISTYLAQLAHETGSFKWMSEIWGPTDQQKKYERDFDHAWPPVKGLDEVNRLAFNLGNAVKGDGYNFRGRGGFHHTGRKNYEILSKELNYDFISNPDDLEKFAGASMMADGVYWIRRNLNQWADLDSYDGFKEITRKINGGYTHLDRRVDHWNVCRQALGLLPIKTA